MKIDIRTASEAQLALIKRCLISELEVKYRRTDFFYNEEIIEALNTDSATLRRWITIGRDRYLSDKIDIFLNLLQLKSIGELLSRHIFCIDTYNAAVNLELAGIEGALFSILRPANEIFNGLKGISMEALLAFNKKLYKQFKRWL